MSPSPGELEEIRSEDLAAREFSPQPSDQAIQGRSLGQIAWRRLRRDKVAMAGGVFVIFLTLVAIFAKPILAWYGQYPNTVPNHLLDESTKMPLGGFGGASSDHWLGVTPYLGEDVLAQLIYGARTSLIIGVLATVLAVALGVTTGLAAGYYRGVTDTILSRLMDVLLSFPPCCSPPRCCRSSRLCRRSRGCPGCRCNSQ